MRLIDAEALENEIVKTGRFVPKDAVLDVACMVNRAPAIEAKPVVHAYWKEYYPPKEFILTGEEKLYICSKCDAKYSHIENQRFCPWCGALMDESISCSHEDDNHIAEDGKKGIKIPVISMEDVPKVMDELPSVEENPILKAVKEMEK